MINISIPFSVKAGPGVETFALALNSYIKIKIKSFEKNSSEKGIFFEPLSKVCNLTEEFCFMSEKVYKFFKRNYNIENYKIELEIECDKQFLPFLNQADTFMLILIKVVDILHNLNFDEEKTLKILKKMSGAVECGVASLMGGLGVADRDKKNFLSLSWPDEWKVKILKINNKNKHINYFMKPEFDIVSDVSAKTAFFTSAVCSKSRFLLFSSMQDKLNYSYGCDNVPFIDKLNLICRTCGIYGMSYLKNDSGIIIIGENHNFDECLKRIKILYDRNNINYEVFEYKCEKKGLNIWEE